jgi:selenocysteine lyase/cysteine desulfurase
MIKPLMMGGTGSRSEFEAQPDFMPDKYESGTPNTIGCAGLYAGVSFVLERTVEGVRAVEEKLMARFLSQMADMPGSLKIYGPNDAFKQTAVVSFNIDGISASDAALHFEERYGILCRAGLHCAPSAHHTLGTFPGGAIRFSFGYFNTNQDVDTAVEAVRSLVIR